MIRNSCKLHTWMDVGMPKIWQTEMVYEIQIPEGKRQEKGPVQGRAVWSEFE